MENKLSFVAFTGFLTAIIDVTSSTICTHAYIQSYYTSYGRLKYRKRYTDIYCAETCCGDLDSHYCCEFKQETSVSEILGIVIGALSGCLILLFFCLCIWLVTSKHRRNRRLGHRNTANISHISGQLRRSTQGDVSLPPSYEETVLGYDNNGFSRDLYSLPPSYNEVFFNEPLKTERDTENVEENIPSSSSEGGIGQPTDNTYTNNGELSRAYNRSESVTSDSILLHYNRENDDVMTYSVTSANVDDEIDRGNEVNECSTTLVTEPHSSVSDVC